MKHPNHLSMKELTECFPYNTIRGNQHKAFEIISNANNSLTLELPTGSGKTAIGYTVLKALEQQGKKNLFYVAPTKTIVEQIKRLHPDVKIIFGKNEYQCLYYTDDYVPADASPCLSLSCPHRIDQNSGQTVVSGSQPCPYLHAKYQAQQGGIVVSTMAFYLFAQLLSQKWARPDGLIVDEAHRFAKVARSCLSYEISDYHLTKMIDIFLTFEPETASILNDFLHQLKRIIKSKRERKLLEQDEIKLLINILLKTNGNNIEKAIKEAVRKGRINPKADRQILKQMEVITYDLRRYINSLEFSCATENHKPLNYTYGYYKEENRDNKKQYGLCINAYYVSSIIKKILSPFTIAYSATIGDAETFGFETGIKFPFHSFDSDFPNKNSRIFLPTDTANLAVKSRRKRDPIITLKQIANACKEFNDKKIRCLVVAVSEVERKKFLEICGRFSVSAISYGNGVKPREAVKMFQDGQAMVLVGTASNYSEGVDLPNGMAPVIFFLRPGYPSPNDPATLFEERRFGNKRWQLWNWRVMIEALQVIGRNIRSAEDMGVCFFISQQFRRFLFPALPRWMQNSYCGNKNLNQTIQETKVLLK